MPTTDAELRLIANAAIRGDSNQPVRDREPGGDGDAQRVVEEGEHEVLLHVAHGTHRERASDSNATQVALDQRDLSAVHRHVGSRSHGDAHVCLRQGRRVVDAVSGHGDDAAFFLQPLDQHELVRRLDLTMHLVDA